ncbi:MAG: MEDS domain-containing protein [Taibaiella sp.]|nr:MEDS domain-containing protein [Taibaiella sp.]
MRTEENWKHAKVDTFWGELAPCDHVVQLYETDEIFLDTLAGFVGEGIKAGDCVVVIATENHIADLNRRMAYEGLQTEALIASDQYIPLDADKTLAAFMRNGWPDDEQFINTVSQIIKRAQSKNRNVRAFGEMVAILWAQGNSGATVRLEHLWNEFCEKQAFSLFCAYPKSGFTMEVDESLMNICCAHAKIISGSIKHATEVFYQRTVQTF